MIVSHFELIFKPQAPANAAGVAVDRVVQGYFLEITNLEDQEYRYALDFIVSPGNAAQPERSLAGNTIVQIDTPPSTNNLGGVLTGAVDASVFRPSQGLIRIPPRGTAKVAVLPSVFGSALDPTPLSTPNFEVRGYVAIRLPAVFQAAPPFGLNRVPQANAPVKVLLTPQNRATFFSAPPANQITGQVQASVPVGGGDPVLSLPPEPGGPLFFTPVVRQNITDALRDEVAALASAPCDLLALLLAGFEGNAPDLAAFNASLRANNVPFAVERRGTP